MPKARAMRMGKTKIQNTISGSRIVSLNRARVSAARGCRMGPPSAIAQVPSRQ